MSSANTTTIFNQEDWIWIPHDVSLFVPAKVMKPFVCGNKGLVKSEDGQEIELDGAMSGRCLLMDTQSLSSVSDMAKLNNLDEPSLLHNLRLRFENDIIYTNVSTILISVNPFAHLPLYSKDTLEKYLENGPDLPPHIFSIAGTLHFILS